MKKLVLILSTLVLTVFVTGCELPDIAGLNSMPETTGKMNAQMLETNRAIHMQTLLLSLNETIKKENLENIYPVPTGLMPAGKAFAETATATELVELTYLELTKLEENTLVTGFGEEGPIPLTEQEKNYSRLRKIGTLSALQVIAGFAQEEKVDEIVRHQIEGNGRYANAAIAFLVLRAYFIREVLLKLSLKIDASKAQTLDNSGMMNTAITYLKQLDRLSRMSFTNYPVLKLKLAGEATLTNFDENLKVSRPETAAYWQLAIDKALEGSKVYLARAVPGSDQSAEIAKQNHAIQVMRDHLAAWQTPQWVEATGLR